MNKKIRYGILILLVAAIAIYNYTYQEHRDISSEKATYTISIPTLKKEFATNDSLAFAKYQDQTIELTAKITTIDTENKAVILDNKVFATFNDSLPKDIVSGKKIKIKGRFLGYDELLEEFKIDQSSIIR
ncbi:OB-fold protein [Flavobacterium sp. GSA192]|uniref:OB-fold protein n=1 Tax=Flavobacterium sp. GSA192 TaxID=2576304 RepID=UPI001128A5D1|nr:hypothetical protein [Flavobacterium sp. GSA192]